MAGRLAVQRAVERVLGAHGLDDLFDGPAGEAPLLREVLADLARGRAGRWYGMAVRLARRRGRPSGWVFDRAALLLAALEARVRDDCYRSLEAPPLAGVDELAARWDALRRTRAGDDPVRLRAARAAWDLLRDPARRAAYEAWWVRSLGPLDGHVARRGNGGGAGAPAGHDPAIASDASAVAASSAGTSTSGSASGGAEASRARPSRSKVRAPRGLPCAR